MIIELTPDWCKETEKADSGAHLIWDRILPFISIRLSMGEAPTAKIWQIIPEIFRRNYSKLIKLASSSC